MDLSGQHSAGIAQRVQEAVGDTTLREVSRATQHHPETVRRYLASGKVSTEFIVRVSIAFGVRAEWLLTGQGPRTEAAYRVQAIAQADIEDLVLALGSVLAADRTKIERLEAKIAALEAVLVGDQTRPEPCRLSVTAESGSSLRIT